MFDRLLALAALVVLAIPVLLVAVQQLSRVPIEPPMKMGWNALTLLNQ